MVVICAALCRSTFVNVATNAGTAGVAATNASNADVDLYFLVAASGGFTLPLDVSLFKGVPSSRSEGGAEHPVCCAILGSNCKSVTAASVELSLKQTCCV